MMTTLMSVSSGNTSSLDYVTQPIFYFGIDGVTYKSIPKVVNHLDVEFKAKLYSSPTRAEGDNQDLNLISLCKVSVALTRRSTANQAMVFTIDISKAVIPKDVEFTAMEVGRMAAKAVRQDFPDPKLTQIVIFDGTKTTNENENEKE